MLDPQQPAIVPDAELPKKIQASPERQRLINSVDSFIRLCTENPSVSAMSSSSADLQTVLGTMKTSVDSIVATWDLVSAVKKIGQPTEERPHDAASAIIPIVVERVSAKKQALQNQKAADGDMPKIPLAKVDPGEEMLARIFKSFTGGKMSDSNLVRHYSKCTGVFRQQ